MSRVRAGFLLAVLAAMIAVPGDAKASRASGKATAAPQVLTEGASAYFAGEYQRTLDLLRAATFSDQKAEIQRRLFVAAAAYSLLQLGGGTDPALRAIAADHVRACRALSPRFVPDEKVFTPRFVAWFRANR